MSAEVIRVQIIVRHTFQKGLNTPFLFRRGGGGGPHLYTMHASIILPKMNDCPLQIHRIHQLQAQLLSHPYSLQSEVPVRPRTEQPTFL